MVYTGLSLAGDIVLSLQRCPRATLPPVRESGSGAFWLLPDDTTKPALPWHPRTSRDQSTTIALRSLLEVQTRPGRGDTVVGER